MSEIQRYADSILSVDVKNDGKKDDINEKKIKETARNYVLREQKTLSPEQFKVLVGRVIEIIGKQDISLEHLNTRYEHERQEILADTRRATMVASRPKEFSGVQTLWDISYVIDAKSAESMQILEDAIGLDDPDTVKWQAKILLLVMAHTSMELGKGLADILKIGEGTAEGSLALDRNDLTILQKTWEMTKWVGTDGLRAFGATGILRPLGWQLSRILGKVQIPKNLFLNIVENLSSGWPKGRMYYQRGAVGDLNNWRPRSVYEQAAPVRKPIEVPRQVTEMAPAKIWELKWEFTSPRNSPTDNLHHLENMNAKLDVNELINTKSGIRNLSQSLDNLTTYIESNHNRIWSLKLDFAKELIELKKVLKQITSNKNLPEEDAILLRNIVDTNLPKAIYTLNPRLWPTS